MIVGWRIFDPLHHFPILEIRHQSLEIGYFIGPHRLRRVILGEQLLISVEQPGDGGDLLLREKVIKPLLAGVTRPYRRSPKISAPLDQHYLKLCQELHQTFETIDFAAA